MAPPTGERMGPEIASAPELTGFASRQWIAGLLDPEQVDSQRYYGNTRFASGIMVTFVKQHMEDVDAADRDKIAAALATEAGRASLAEDEPQVIAAGRDLIVSQGCTRCHGFHDHGENGQAPDLTGYGSHEWIVGMIANPAHPWFYDVGNGGLPLGHLVRGRFLDRSRSTEIHISTHGERRLELRRDNPRAYREFDSRYCTKSARCSRWRPEQHTRETLSLYPI